MPYLLFLCTNKILCHCHCHCHPFTLPSLNESVSPSHLPSMPASVVEDETCNECKIQSISVHSYHKRLPSTNCSRTSPMRKTFDAKYSGSKPHFSVKYFFMFCLLLVIFTQSFISLKKVGDLCSLDYPYYIDIHGIYLAKDLLKFVRIISYKFHYAVENCFSKIMSNFLYLSKIELLKEFWLCLLNSFLTFWILDKFQLVNDTIRWEIGFCSSKIPKL